MALHSRTELKRRPVRGNKRAEIAKDLQNQLPRRMFLDNLKKIEDDVMESGCRDEAPTPQVLKTMSWEERKKSRLHKNEMLSLQKMLENKKNSSEEVLQKVFLHPKGVVVKERHRNFSRQVP